MPHHFSTRTAWDSSESDLSRAIRDRGTSGLPVWDLTIANPTVCGFDYPADLLAPLAQPAALRYDPDPRGILSARAAVARYALSHGAKVDPAHIVLTTSTSEAYSFLFRLLCDPCDAILAPQPSYPLFDFLADLDNVLLAPYPLFADFGWWIDFAELERRITPRTRAIILVHPNNPTGHATTRAERDRLQSLCAEHHLALIVDEVFLDYGLGGPIESFAVGPHPCLTFVVSGLSKVAALSQMKVGWVACFGPGEVQAEALSRLEIIADTFLSMNAPVQHALPIWLEGASAMQAQLRDRVRTNLATLITAPQLTLLPVEAGWAAVLKFPVAAAEEGSAAMLVADTGVVVHPGSFYGLPGSRFIVVSLIGPVDTFCEGIEKLNLWCESRMLTHLIPR